MYNYMTPLEGLAVDEHKTKQFQAEVRPTPGLAAPPLFVSRSDPPPAPQGHDMDSLLFNFLDELLFEFHTGGFACRELRVTELDKTGFRLRAEGRGEIFRPEEHESGTEIKAITYSAMQILDRPGDCEIFVIVDI